MNHLQRIEPKPGQESVWDYPRPPLLERCLRLASQSPKQVRIIFNDITIADSGNTYRVLETSHPPVYYIPPVDIKTEYLEPANSRSSFCEWKGLASYYNLTVGDKQVQNAAWYYSSPTDYFAPIKDYLAFYPSKMDACYVDDELVKAQAGDFYGGWVTQDIVGPFKGELGTWGW
ncbi:DUF427 domain-containing protein [Pleurocapsa sp. FMAR1]|uniref:DUF427 domain-containing protein n=1 Tax=Pleurocapsa sp. FMAR1 TaxID=3040204 RepID=UPI0029C616B0|nr:DUF427 domain-containing protein [Pleurocapsa sp. FMAR1]